MPGKKTSEGACYSSLRQRKKVNVNESRPKKGASCDNPFAAVVLPPEVMLMILASLSIRDLKAVRTVSRVWSSSATTLLEKKSTLNLNEDLLDQLIEEPYRTFGTRFRSIRIHYFPPTEGRRGHSFGTYQKKVLAALGTRMEGGGSSVEKLTFSKLRAPPKQRTTFLNTLFSICPKVVHITVINSNLFCRKALLEPLPILHNCRTVAWLNGSGSFGGPSQFFLESTPNVEKVVDPRGDLLSALDDGNPRYWIYLQVVQQHNPPLSQSSAYNLAGLNRPLKSVSFYALPALTHSPLLPVMRAHWATLEVLEIQDDGGSAGVYSRDDDYLPAPIMTKLVTLSVLNLRSNNFWQSGFMFGNMLYPNHVQHPMSLATHFPALTTLRFTVQRSYGRDPPKEWLLLLNYFPMLLEDDENDVSCYPKITTLELSWPQPEEDYQLWKDWTRRVVSKFPNVEGNPHIDKWDQLDLEEEEDGGHGGGDRVQEEWKNYVRRYEESKGM